MPEYPDIVVYVETIAARVVGQPLERVRLASPFVLRSVDPPLSAVAGKRVTGVSRIGKRIVLELEGDLYLVIHLMVAGRFRWKEERAAKIPGKIGLAAFDFPTGTLIFTEASTKKRASLHVVGGAADLAAFHRGGIDVLDCDLAAFREVLARESHTLKRTLTDPRLINGIGNAYSDEILHRAKLSPVRLTGKLTAEDSRRLYQACRTVLVEWADRLRKEAGKGFPEKVTAFREEMAVHGKFGKPCPVCGSPVQRIVHAENETNYCATCQTDGKLLADRSLSRLLHGDWPRTIDELEEWKAERREKVP